MSVTEIIKNTRRQYFVAKHHWVSFIMVTSLGVQALGLFRLVLRYDRPPMTPDAGIFQHIGWYLVHGGRLYVDAWEPKLPLSFETTAALALISGGDMTVFHYLNVVLMIGATVGTVVLVGLLTHYLTENPTAAVVASLSLYLLPGFAIRPVYGFKAKYMLIVAGLLAIYLALYGHYLASGAVAAASVGYWQLGAIFPIIVLGLALQERDWDALGSVVTGGFVFTTLMVAPVVLFWHSGSEMVAQAILIPLLSGNEASIGEKLLAGVLHFKWAAPLVLVGVYGAWRGTTVTRQRPDWWVLAGGAWFGAVVLLFDFDVGGYTDLIPGLAFVAIGVGLVIDSLDAEASRLCLGSVVAGLVLFNVVTFGGIGLVFSPADTPAPTPMDELRHNDRADALAAVDDDVPDVRYLYWQQMKPETCHYRLSLLEVNWLERVGNGPQRGCSDVAEVRTVLGW